MCMCMCVFVCVCVCVFVKNHIAHGNDCLAALCCAGPLDLFPLRPEDEPASICPCVLSVLLGQRQQ